MRTSVLPVGLAGERCSTSPEIASTDTPPRSERVLDRAARDPRHLLGLADQLAVVTALDEQALRVGLLEEVQADLRAGDL